MLQLAKRDILTFFNSSLGYTVFIVFYILNGLLLWFFTSPFNIIDSGFADLHLFFELTPWLFIIFLPALGMKSFAEEFQIGTIELLFAKPLTTWEIVLGKFLSIFGLVMSLLLIALIYLIPIHQLMDTATSFDWGIFWISLLGLTLLAALFSSITLFCSSLFKNYFSAFLVSILVLFFQYYGWQQIASFINDFNTYDWITSIGILTHYQQMTFGVLDLGDFVYMSSLTFIFLELCHQNIKKERQ